MDTSTSGALESIATGTEVDTGEEALESMATGTEVDTGEEALESMATGTEVDTGEEVRVIHLPDNEDGYMDQDNVITIAGMYIGVHYCSFRSHEYICFYLNSKVEN